MKTKILLLFMIVAMFITPQSQAQNSKTRHQGEVLAGYSIGIGTLNLDRINLHTVQGVRFNEYVSVGVGIGLDYFYKFDLYRNSNYVASELAMPIFFNAKGYLPVSPKTSMFLSFDIGVGIGLTQGIEGAKGLTFTPAIGASFKVSPQNAITLSAGYNYQAWSEGIFTINTDAISFKVGFQF